MRLSSNLLAIARSGGLVLLGAGPPIGGATPTSGGALLQSFGRSTSRTLAGVQSAAAPVQATSAQQTACSLTGAAWARHVSTSSACATGQQIPAGRLRQDTGRWGAAAGAAALLAAATATAAAGYWGVGEAHAEASSRMGPKPAGGTEAVPQPNPKECSEPPNSSNKEAPPSAAPTTLRCGAFSVMESKAACLLGSKFDSEGLPVLPCPVASAPNVPPPITRMGPAHLVLKLETISATLAAGQGQKYPFWTYNGTVPGPVVRCRVGDILELQHTNWDKDGIGHNVDMHAVSGPGGGAPVTYAEVGETKTGRFKLLYPGVFIYHCAAAPVPTHIANGMYGLMIVEPEEGLPPVDKEFCVVQSEIYATDSTTERGMLEYDHYAGLQEEPALVVFNGREGALTDKPLMVNQEDTVRIFFGNAGPNLISSFHIIGCIFDKVFREGDLVSPPARYLGVTAVPSGGAAVVEFVANVPGNLTMVDHSIYRIDKGAVGFIKVAAKEGTLKGKDIYDSLERPNPCAGCKLHN